MMKQLKTIFTLPMAAIAMTAPAALAAQPPEYGVWANPSKSVHIKLHACGTKNCGTVVWASDAARADAAREGTRNLIGTMLLRDFVANGDGSMKGKVFVPDMNATFAGTIKLVDPNTLRAKGCILGGLFCKSQNWTRVQ